MEFSLRAICDLSLIIIIIMSIIKRNISDYQQNLRKRNNWIQYNEDLHVNLFAVFVEQPVNWNGRFANKEALREKFAKSLTAERTWVTAIWWTFVLLDWYRNYFGGGKRGSGCQLLFFRFFRLFPSFLPRLSFPIALHPSRIFEQTRYIPGKLVALLRLGD